ncbi:hypothetical protein AB0C33_40135 [Nonomuraea sp. NPDC048881]|uniref:hypothetical protein n=1 Tax=Nonomuraea sp. NPDC048881 TaxID=3155030 RepID=UPI00340B0189
MNGDALGAAFARALAAKDRDTLHALLGDPVDFKALTPGAHWDADDPGEVVDRIILGQWFEPGATRHLVEQQVYYGVAGERIAWLRILCSGFRPVPDGEPSED